MAKTGWLFKGAPDLSARINSIASPLAHSIRIIMCLVYLLTCEISWRRLVTCSGQRLTQTANTAVLYTRKMCWLNHFLGSLRPLCIIVAKFTHCSHDQVSKGLLSKCSVLYPDRCGRIHGTRPTWLCITVVWDSRGCRHGLPKVVWCHRPPLRGCRKHVAPWLAPIAPLLSNGWLHPSAALLDSASIRTTDRTCGFRPRRCD